MPRRQWLTWSVFPTLRTLPSTTTTDPGGAGERKFTEQFTVTPGAFPAPAMTAVPMQSTRVKMQPPCNIPKKLQL